MLRTSSLAVLLAILLATSSWGMEPRQAIACSAPDFDPVADVDVIFGGHVVDMSLAGDEPGRGPTAENVAVWVEFEVDRYLKGAGPSQLTALDTSSVAFRDGQTPEQRAAFEGARYEGAAGACGTLDEDPRGQYWLTGASIREDGTVLLNRIHLVGVGGVGTGSDDPFIRERLERIEALLAEAGIAPAATGGGGVVSERSSATPLVLALLAAVVLVAGGRRFTRHAG